jgi:regulator of sirC expression with transglutaminase-like and TPR domain
MEFKEEMAKLLNVEPVDLLTAALLLGRIEGSRADPAPYRALLEELASGFAERLDKNSSVRGRLQALSRYLFEEHGFRGNRDDYYDPKNSFLEEVLDRKLGIPITLSLVYIEVGRRVGLPLVGIGFPGHFLVRYEDVSEEIYIDPFNGGRLLTRSDLEPLLEEMYHGQLALDPAFLQPVTERQFLTRMLYNLKAIYMRAEDFDKLLQVLDLILLLNPESAVDIRDRGLVLYEKGSFVRARSDLEDYLRLDPDAGDAEVIKAHLREIEVRMAMYR